jgi:hypothetical protein
MHAPDTFTLIQPIGGISGAIGAIHRQKRKKGQLAAEANQLALILSQRVHAPVMEKPGVPCGNTPSPLGTRRAKS